jgi:hypothetical protein
MSEHPKLQEDFLSAVFRFPLVPKETKEKALDALAVATHQFREGRDAPVPHLGHQPEVVFLRRFKLPEFVSHSRSNAGNPKRFEE